MEKVKKEDLELSDGERKIVLRNGFHRGNYSNLAEKIRATGDMLSDLRDASMLLHSAYCSKKPTAMSLEARKLNHDGVFHVFQRNSSFGEKYAGTFVMNDVDGEGLIGYNPEFDGLWEKLRNAEKIQTPNGAVLYKPRVGGFAPNPTIILGRQPPQQLKNNGLILAGAGRLGAEQLSEIAGAFTGFPYIWGDKVGDDQKSKHRVSALCEGNNSLCIYFYIDGSTVACGFGVSK